jgi:hypothetical protein
MRTNRRFDREGLLCSVCRFHRDKKGHAAGRLRTLPPRKPTFESWTLIVSFSDFNSNSRGLGQIVGNAAM